MKKQFTILLLSLFAVISCTQKKSVIPPSIEAFDDCINHWNAVHKERNYDRYDPAQYCEIADNLIAYQNEDGGWPKNIDWLAILNTDSVYQTLDEPLRVSTLDNQSTFSQIEYLAEVYRITEDSKYKDASLKGIIYMLDAQRANGGWRGYDVDAVTFNDEVTTGALILFRNIIKGDENFTWLDKEMRQRMEVAYDKGVRVILDCQVEQDGVKTAWGQQHDNETLLPVGGASYELPALTANESCPVILFLMEIENPSSEVVDAVKSAVAWLEKVQIKGLRVDRGPVEGNKNLLDRVAVEDPEAKPIWARCYEVSDNTPFMATLEGEKVWKLEDVDLDRRTGYSWYGYWPEKVLKEYPAWLEKIGQ